MPTSAFDSPAFGDHVDRGGGVTRAGDVVTALLGGAMGRGLSEAQKVARAWYAANGDRERAHTTAVWLRKSGRAGVDPTLMVAVDSGLLAAELGTNKDLYLSRLAYGGVAVGDIRFVVRPASGASQGGPKGGRSGIRRGVAADEGNVSRETQLPQLSQTERESVDEACATLPDGLRQSVSRAMCASLAKNKAHTT